MFIPVEFSAGTNIGTAIKEAHAFSVKMGVAVSFKFNGVNVNVYPKSNLAGLEKMYYEDLKPVCKRGLRFPW
jgi:hypothetical protein